MFDKTILVFLPMILFLGIITSYEDRKSGKIRNKWILVALAYAAVANAVIYFVVLSSGVVPRIAYFVELAISVIISLFIGFAMWWIGLWTAGDAKLFTAYAALVPLSAYTYGNVPYFSSSNILINTFVPFFFVYAVLLLFKTSGRQKLFYLKKSVEPMLLLYLFLFLFGFIWPVGMFFRYTRIPGNYFFSIFFLFLLLVIMEKAFKGRLLWLMIVVSVLRIIFDRTILTTASWVNLLVVFASFVLLRFFILYMGYDYLTKHVDIKLLSPGMVPAEAVYLEDGKYKKRHILHFSLLEYLQETARKRKYLFEPVAEGLSDKDVKTLKTLEKQLGFEHLRIYKTLAFSPYLFAGVLLTIIFQGNLFITLVLLMH